MSQDVQDRATRREDVVQGAQDLRLLKRIAEAAIA
jgi:hypothetical protein